MSWPRQITQQIPTDPCGRISSTSGPHTNLALAVPQTRARWGSNIATFMVQLAGCPQNKCYQAPRWPIRGFLEVASVSYLTPHSHVGVQGSGFFTAAKDAWIFDLWAAFAMLNTVSRTMVLRRRSLWNSFACSLSCTVCISSWFSRGEMRLICCRKMSFSAVSARAERKSRESTTD